jgi:hypothetical protein
MRSRPARRQKSAESEGENEMSYQTLKRTKILLLATMLGACASLEAAPTCSLASLQGNYGFTITGQILSGPAAGLVSGVALTTFNGDGTLTQVDHVLHNGQTPPEPWRNANGSYTLNSNCTGTMQLVFTDGSPTLNLYIVLDSLRWQIRTVVDANAITSLGTKQGAPKE